jgi:hypothetical protein
MTRNEITRRSRATNESSQSTGALSKFSVEISDRSFQLNIFGIQSTERTF